MKNFAYKGILLFVAVFTAEASPLKLSCGSQARQHTQFHSKQNFTAECPAGCTSGHGQVRGTYVYTDDSSICVSALHAGVITGHGGVVVVSRLPGRHHYPGTSHNGIRSQSAGHWTRSSSFRFAAQDCEEIIGVRHSKFPDENFQASSIHRSRFFGKWSAYKARLEKGSLINAWRPKSDDTDQWWQVDLKEEYEVKGIITQGSSFFTRPQYIKTYKIQHKLFTDGEFTYAMNDLGTPKIFEGNHDKDDRVTNYFVPSLIARYIRLKPVSWYRHISLRVELIGCKIWE